MRPDTPPAATRPSARRLLQLMLWGLAVGLSPLAAQAQVAPNAVEVARYSGLMAAAQRGDLAGVKKLIAARTDVNVRDGFGRTSIHVATFARQPEVIRALAQAGGNLETTKFTRITRADFPKVVFAPVHCRGEALPRGRVIFNDV